MSKNPSIIKCSLLNILNLRIPNYIGNEIPLKIPHFTKLTIKTLGDL